MSIYEFWIDKRSLKQFRELYFNATINNFYLFQKNPNKFFLQNLNYDGNEKIYSLISSMVLKNQLDLLIKQIIKSRQ